MGTEKHPEGLVVTLDDDPYEVFERQCGLPEDDRKHTLFIDARTKTVEDLRRWLDQCASTPGFLEGSAAEWLVHSVIITSRDEKPVDFQGEQWEWIQVSPI